MCVYVVSYHLSNPRSALCVVALGSEKWAEKSLILTGAVRKEIITPDSSQITHLLEDAQNSPNISCDMLYHPKVRCKLWTRNKQPCNVTVTRNLDPRTARKMTRLYAISLHHPGRQQNGGLWRLPCPLWPRRRANNSSKGCQVPASSNIKLKKKNKPTLPSIDMVLL